jgi:hypothetical protein
LAPETRASEREIFPYRAVEAPDDDLAITRIVAPIEDHMHVEALFAISRFVVAATGNPWSRRSRVRLADLKKVGRCAAGQPGWLVSRE